MKGDITYVDAGNGLVMLDDGNGGYITTAASTNTTAYTIASDVMNAIDARVNKLEPVCTDEEWETFCNEVGLINE